MPDIQQFKITPRADTVPAVTMARVTVEAKVLADDGAVVADYTGANAFDFVFRVQGWTAKQHREFADDVALMIVRRKAGLE